MIRPTRLALLGLLLPSLACAQPALPQPEQFAWQWTLPVPAGQSMARFELSEDVYAHLLRNDLSDLAAFNAQGDSLPMGPASEVFAIWPSTAEPPLVVVPALPLPRSGTTDPAQLEVALSAARRGLRIDIAPESEPSAPATDWLIPLDGLSAGIRGLQVELDPQAVGQLHARIELAGSDDLSLWQPLGAAQTLLSVRQGEMQLERLRLEFPTTATPAYVRLRRIDSATALPLHTVRAEPRARTSTAPALKRLSLEGTPVEGVAGVFDYRLTGPFPIQSLRVELADSNSVARILLESRTHDGSHWQERLRTTAFRLDDKDGDVDAPAQRLPLSRDRLWRVVSVPALSKAPRLHLEYAPDSFVLLAQGEGPYQLAAGSALARRPDYPLTAAFAEMRARHGADWLPADIVPRNGEALAGDRALLTPTAPVSWRSWLLWSVLIVGSLTVAGLAISLLRKAPETR